MKMAQLQQQAAQLRIQAQSQEQLAAAAFRAASSAASNNIMVAAVSGYRTDANPYGVPSGAVSVTLSEGQLGC